MVAGSGELWALSRCSSCGRTSIWIIYYERPADKVGIPQLEVPDWSPWSRYGNLVGVPMLLAVPLLSVGFGLGVLLSSGRRGPDFDPDFLANALIVGFIGVVGLGAVTSLLTLQVSNWIAATLAQRRVISYIAYDWIGSVILFTSALPALLAGLLIGLLRLDVVLFGLGALTLVTSFVFVLVTEAKRHRRSRQS